MVPSIWAVRGPRNIQMSAPCRPFFSKSRPVFFGIDDMTEDELERLITTLIERKDAAPEDSAERLLLERQLAGPTALLRAHRADHRGAGPVLGLLPDQPPGSRTGSRQRPQADSAS
jgi:hypothetical protein